MHKIIVKMNRTLLSNTLKLVGLVAMSAIAVCSCDQAATKQQASASDTLQAAKPDVVRKSLPFSGTFTQINNMASVDVEYSVGECRVEAEGPAELVKLVRITVDSGTLTVTYNYDNNPDINVFKRTGTSVKIYVSSPSLRIVSACGTGSIHAVGKVETEEFMGGTLASGNIQFDTLVCHGPFRYESKNVGKSKFVCLVTEGTANFINEGTGSIEVENLIADDAVLVNHNGSSTTFIHGTAPDVEVWSFAQGNVDLDMTVDNIIIKAFDESKVQFKGTYGSKTVKQDQTAYVTLTE